MTKLPVERVLDIPMREVSGLCLAHLRGEFRVLAVGDRTSELAHAVVTPSPDWATLDLSDVVRIVSDDPQLEAITADGAGTVVLLQEGPAQAWVVTTEPRRAVQVTLSIDPSTDLGRAWAADENSRGEGVVLLSGGHLLVAKEKRPAALVEFGPAGDEPVGWSFLEAGGAFDVPAADVTFEALAVWPLSGDAADVLHDVSDAAVGPDGRLYLLSDQSSTIGRAVLDGGEVALDASWTIKGKPDKAEGLAILPDGRAVVALDTRQPRDNLLVLGSVIH